MVGAAQGPFLSRPQPDRGSHLWSLLTQSYRRVKSWTIHTPGWKLLLHVSSLRLGVTFQLLLRRPRMQMDWSNDDHLRFDHYQLTLQIPMRVSLEICSCTQVCREFLSSFVDKTECDDWRVKVHWKLRSFMYLAEVSHQASHMHEPASSGSFDWANRQRH